MSVIIFIAPLFSAVACALLWLVCWQIATRSGIAKTRAAILALGVFALFPISCIAIIRYLPPGLREEAAHTTSNDARKILKLIDIPDAASDVTCHHDLFAAVIEAAEFTITEADFTTWVNANQWQVTAFNSPDEYDSAWRTPRWFTTVFDREHSAPVSRGYYFDTYPSPQADSGTAVLYDSEQQRCYITVTNY